MSEHTQSQRERLNYLEFRLGFTGQMARADLTKRFGISEAAVTRDLAIYRTEAGSNLEFDTVSKCYRASRTFRLIYLQGVDAKQLIRAVVHGIGNDFGSEPELLVPCELPPPLLSVDVDVLATVSRAICQKRVLQINYQSASGDHGPRQIVPLSLVGTGLKLMVRAYCRRKHTFSDFVLARFRTAEVLWDEVPSAAESGQNDDEWNRMLKLELIPHPKESPAKSAMTSQEFQMADGVHVLRVRAALAVYVLRLWNVDCSHDRSGKNMPLCLRNLLALHDVENAHLAPGYQPPPMN